jgi:hypothetical protein
LLEDRRNGTANPFAFSRLWRKVKVTERRAAGDFAPACANAPTSTIQGGAIRVVLDNLSTISGWRALSHLPGG